MAVFTFLFTDIEGSTRLWDAFPSSMNEVISRHDELLHGAVQASGGTVFKHTGDGMAAVFPDACGAVAASLQAQQSLANEDWGDIGSLKVRMGIHTGDVNERDGDYFGPSLNHVGRLMSAAYGGQVLVSIASAKVCIDLPGDVTLIDLGIHRLRDLAQSETIYQLTHPDLSTDFPPIKSEKTSNLPDHPDSLLGRETELQQLMGLLKDSRLITLTGFGGTGKTRLALELGHRALGQFQDGVWFLGLAPISDPGVLLKETASLFGVGQDSLSGYLADKKLLLIVDNCEHVVGGAAALVKQLMSSAGITVVATSREALNLGGEHTYGVSPLPIPAVDSDHKTMIGTAAVQLFVRLAESNSPSFELTPDNAVAVGQIVRRLDGIPLAIELAASRIKLLPPADIANRLDDSFKLLKGGKADALPHHQTLEATIDWSYDMLSPDQQMVFRQISAFRGGFTLTAFAAVVGMDDEYDALESLGELVDKSLVQTTHTSEDVRYQMLEPLLQYGAQRISADEAVVAKNRHGSYFLGVAEAAEPELMGPQQLEWLSKLEAEHDNFRSVLTWALESGNADLAQRSAAALMWFWVIHRHVPEGAAWFDRVLALEEGPPGSRARALLQAGFIQAVIHNDNLERPRALIQEGANIYAQMQDGQGMGQAHLYTAQNFWYARDFEKSAPMFIEIQEIMRTQGFVWGDGFCGWFRGSTAWFIGDLDAARQHYDRSLEIFEELGDLKLIAWSLITMANIESDANDFKKSSALFGRAIPLMNDLGDRLGVGTATMGLGLVNHYVGDDDAARRQIAEAQTLLREGSGGQGLSWALANAQIDTRTIDLMVANTFRYQSSLELPADEWTRMVIADGEEWRERALISSG
ncbi:MAG: tetratricopeptide repeat protein [Chloroflexi bacterium]|nr:tetratricopeptide repeat protein [Chloroflexota bacterium]